MATFQIDLTKDVCSVCKRMEYVEENKRCLACVAKILKKQSGAICGDGMCPYVPCKDYPKCVHGYENK